MTTTLYHYDTNGFFTHTTTARIDELDGSIEIPARATTTPPLGATAPSVDRWDFDARAWTVYTEPVHEPEPIEQQRSKMVISNANARLQLIAIAMYRTVDMALKDQPTSRLGVMWEYGASFHRLDPELIAFCASLGIDDAQLDTLFIDAARL